MSYCEDQYIHALEQKVKQLEKEADWLAANLSKCETDEELPFCPYHIDKAPLYCDYNQEDAEEAAWDGEMPCTHRRDICWRDAARLAVEAES